MKILLTGATGYIGQHFLRRALAQNADVLALLRQRPAEKPDCAFLIPSDWDNVDLLSKTMEGRDVVVHCAGLAHNKQGTMWQSNYELALAVTEAAKKAKVKRVVIISSAAVFGGWGRFGLSDQPNPVNEYGQSKYEAEIACAHILKDSATSLSIIRPPMVIGPMAPGRSETIRNFVQKGWPLPFDGVKTSRSYIHIDHLIDALWQECVAADKSALVHAADPEIPAKDLIRLICQQDNLNPRYLALPAFIFDVLNRLPKMKGRLDPLLKEHVLTSGRISLDHIV